MGKFNSILEGPARETRAFISPVGLASLSDLHAGWENLFLSFGYSQPASVSTKEVEDT